MTDELPPPKDLPKDFVTTEEVQRAGSIERNTVYDWLRHGLLPEPISTGGGVITKWPPTALVLAKFVSDQRKLKFSLKQIRIRLGVAFGEEVFEVLAAPKERSERKRTAKGRSTG